MKNADIADIPNHTSCRNCGSCCGIIPVTTDELTVIRSYLQTHPFVKRYASQHTGQLTCPFRDELMKRCLIYKVRPVICRLFGVTKGMQCKYGNTCEIDGSPHIPAVTNPATEIHTLNFETWF